MPQQDKNTESIKSPVFCTAFALTNPPQKIESINSLRVAVIPLKLDGISPDHFGLSNIQIALNHLMRLQNPQRIRRLGGRAARFTARGAGTFAPQKLQRIAADVPVIPFDLQRPRIGFFHIYWNHNLGKKIGFFIETVYIIANFFLQIKHFYLDEMNRRVKISGNRSQQSENLFGAPAAQ